ncbi:MAG: glycerate kinase [Ignavibacteriales bacterium]|nr:glycerate kinase [Ignavibacteriales bacterium]
MKILIAPNSFKECASSVEIAKLLELAVKQELPGASIVTAPVSDGGDGFLEVCEQYFLLNKQFITIPNCLGTKDIPVPIGYEPQSGVIFLESADVFGVKTIPLEDREIMHSGSFGLGILLQKIMALRTDIFPITKIVIGLGGSAINDFGMGVFAALGGIINSQCTTSEYYLPANFDAITGFIPADGKFAIPIELVLDVEVFLTGKNGTTNTFAQQKGATNMDIVKLEDFGKYAVQVLGLLRKKDLISKKIGASGGVSLGLLHCADIAFITAREFILSRIGIAKYIAENDIVVTGEGRFDRQSLMNKAPGILVQNALASGKKTVVICGSASQEIKEELGGKVLILEMLNRFGSERESVLRFKEGIFALAGEMREALQLKSASEFNL